MAIKAYKHTHLEGSLIGPSYPSRKTTKVASPLGPLTFPATVFLPCIAVWDVTSLLCRGILNPIRRQSALPVTAEPLLPKQARPTGAHRISQVSARFCSSSLKAGSLQFIPGSVFPRPVKTCRGFSDRVSPSSSGIPPTAVAIAAGPRGLRWSTTHREVGSPSHRQDCRSVTLRLLGASFSIHAQYPLDLNIAVIVLTAYVFFQLTESR